MKKAIFLTILLLVLLILPTFILAHTGDDNSSHHMNGMMGWNNWGWGMMGFGWIFMIVFLILSVLGIFALIKYISTQEKLKNK